MKYFIDTEFIEGFHKPLFGKKRHYIDLISIGIVCEDGREFYAISNEYNYNKASEWVKENVIIPLYRQKVFGDQRKVLNERNFHKSYGLSNRQIADAIMKFVNPLIEETPLHTKSWNNHLNKFSVVAMENMPIDFYGYYSDYDWVLFCSLFGRMMDLPKGFPMYCKDLKQMFDEKANSYTSEQLSKIEYPTVSHNVLEYLESSGKIDKPIHLKTHKDYPIQENEHNALDDARWNKKLFDFINGL